MKDFRSAIGMSLGKARGLVDRFAVNTDTPGAVREGLVDAMAASARRRRLLVRGGQIAFGLVAAGLVWGVVNAAREPLAENEGVAPVAQVASKTPDAVKAVVAPARVVAAPAPVLEPAPSNDVEHVAVAALPVALPVETSSAPEAPAPAAPTVVVSDLGRPAAPALDVALPSDMGQPKDDAPKVNGHGADVVRVFSGQSVVIDAPWAVARVSITNVEVADVQVLTPRQVLVIGKTVGTTDMLMWNEDEQVWHASVKVGIDVDSVRSELTRLFPGCNLDVDQSQNAMVVSGTLRRVEQVEQLRATLGAYGLDYVDQTSVAGVQQVMINVRVAEVSRKAIRALGINAVSAGNNFFGGLTIGPDSGGALNPISIGAPAGSPIGAVPFSFVDDLGVASGITMFGGIANSDLEVFIQALAENQYLRVLAEPSLVALSGEQASFLAGGEFPVPVVQGTTAGAGSTVTIEYREFGVRLNFVPHVLGDNRIRLFVAPEVSNLSDFGAVQIEGFRIPALSVRRAETTLELSSGQSFAMAGLLNETTDARNSRVPVLGDLPVLGALFRSTRYVSSETELVVMVNATLVEPTTVSGDFPLPGATHVSPNDWELYANGRLDGAEPAALGPADTAWLHERGLDRLQGPGAWSDHEQAPAGTERSRHNSR